MERDDGKWCHYCVTEREEEEGGRRKYIILKPGWVGRKNILLTGPWLGVGIGRKAGSRVLKEEVEGRYKRGEGKLF